MPQIFNPGRGLGLGPKVCIPGCGLGRIFSTGPQPSPLAKGLLTRSRARPLSFTAGRGLGLWSKICSQAADFLPQATAYDLANDLLPRPQVFTPGGGLCL